MGRTTKLLAAILGLALVGGSGCATVIGRGALGSKSSSLPPYSPVLGDFAVAFYEPLLAPIAIADVPLTLAAETVYLPIYVGGELIDHAHKASAVK